MSTLDNLNASPKEWIDRRIYIKRRLASTGLYEDNWLEITEDVKKFGKVSKEVDATRLNRFRFSNWQFTVANTKGKYGEHTLETSLWNGYLNQQRTLVKVEVSYLRFNDEGYYKSVSLLPGGNLWDTAIWDASLSIYDFDDTSTVFTGLISGDVGSNDKNQITFNCKPLTSVFREFAASRLTGFTSTGITASQFCEILRDQTDGSGSFVFRPFFGDTTSNWDIQTTTTLYPQLLGSTTAATIDKNCWDILEDLAEAENYVPFVTGDGKFNFKSRDAVNTSSGYEFHGAGSFSQDFGKTIKEVSFYGYRASKFYSRVQVQFAEEQTSTSFVTEESIFAVDRSNAGWILGDRTLNFKNTFIGDTATAETVANTLFTELSSLKRELKFKTKLVLGLDIFDQFSVFYDPRTVDARSFWDVRDWSGVADTSTDFYWDAASGSQVLLSGEGFKFLSFEIDLDKLENNFLAREA